MVRHFPEPSHLRSIHSSTQTSANSPPTEPETSVDAVPEVQAQENATKGAASAEKIRYGQALSEQGFGGQTTTSSGTTDPTAGEKNPDQEGKEARKTAGYGGDNDMDREIGA